MVFGPVVFPLSRAFRNVDLFADEENKVCFKLKLRNKTSFF